MFIERAVVLEALVVYLWGVLMVEGNNAITIRRCS